jgi:glyoxylase-like metal-dependent hydrolase (beta-lactamase superfamily II)
MASWAYRKGLHDLGGGSWAYLLPDGGWGWSNSGFISSGGQNLLVDTLFDLPLTAEMLGVLRASVPGAERIDAIVNTHSNGDHTYGNQLVEGARIFATRATAEGMEHDSPERLLKALANPDALGEGGRFMAEIFGKFDFTGIKLPPATDLFVDSLDLRVGDKDVRLVDVGPAHTSSDVLVYVPEDKLVYTGDIMFHQGHIVIWSGPITNWIRACDLILSWDVETIVPGHGPIASRDDVRGFREYLQYLHDESRARFDAGMSFQEAAFDIRFGRFDQFGDAERTVINVHALYGEFAGERPIVQPGEIWNLMARYARERAAQKACTGGCEAAHRH